MRKTLLFTVILILLSTFVYAADYNIETLAIKENILTNETAQYLVTITNNMNSSLEFQMYAPEVEWIVPPQTIKVSGSGETSVKILITPTKYIGPGIYGIKINFKEESLSSVTQKTVYVNIRTGEEAVSAYLPSVSMKSDMPETIDPREKVSIKVSLDNQNVMDHKDLIIRITSELSTFNTEHPIELGSLAKKVIELTYELDPLTEPGEYMISFELLKANESIERGDPKIVEITTIKPDFKEEIVTDSFLLKTTDKITYTSDSNIEDTQIVKIPTNWFKRIFTTTVPASTTITEDGKKYLSIKLTLESGGFKTISAVTNYRYPIIVIIAIILFTIIYYTQRSPIKIRKGISDVETKEGGISELKVMLEIKSIAKKTLKNVTIIDYIPNIASLQKEFVEGTLKPTTILKHPEKGTIVKWVLPEMVPGEDRLISYDLKSKLSILGNFKLPRAKVIYKKKRKDRYAYSNSVGVNA